MGVGELGLDFPAASSGWCCELRQDADTALRMATRAHMHGPLTYTRRCVVCYP